MKKEKANESNRHILMLKVGTGHRNLSVTSILAETSI